MASLLSVNVGLPRDVPWHGKVVHTAVWKAPVTGRVMVRRLNIDGDGQGDLAGHGGEHRAVMVYQLDSYRYWAAYLKRPLPDYGSFGENLTVDGLPDHEVHIGDRYRVGEALLEVTQPRVTCYRVGMRMGVPDMAALLVSHKRPGFYCRVIEEGHIGAGDTLVKEQAGGDMSVAEVDALLYFPAHPEAELQRALQLPALSAGWRDSFKAMLTDGPGKQGNAGLAGPAPERAAWQGFRDVRVVAVQVQSAEVRSFIVEAADGDALAAPRPGQFIVVRMVRTPPQPPLIRSYSISDGSIPGRYRFSVKRGHGEGSRMLHDIVREGSRLAISAPRGSFTLDDGAQPVVFWSAGIGITPLLAMLHALVGRHSGSRKVYWIHGARSRDAYGFAKEVDVLLAQLDHTRLIAFSQPTSADHMSGGYDVAGHLDASHLAVLRIPMDAWFYLCGPTTFMDEARHGLLAAGYAEDNIASELFGGQAAFEPGIIRTAARLPHPLPGDTGEGPVVSFVRSGLDVHWNKRYATLLELAEACDVPVRWSCRSGVCHSCETPLVDGSIVYAPEPLQPPAEGRILLCCATRHGDIQVDL